MTETTIDTTATTRLDALVAALVDEMRDNGIVELLGEAFTLAAILADLFRLAGSPVPGVVEECIES